MRTFGFSTGALAKGDFCTALKMLEAHETTAVELSALRAHELPLLVESLQGGQLSNLLKHYGYCSVHAPSKLQSFTERQVIELLRPLIEEGFYVVVHPDTLDDFGGWREYGARVCIENNDSRKPGRTVAELKPVFDKLPNASWCLDLGHGRQVDGTMLEVWRMLKTFGPKLRQIHLSELNGTCEHEPLSLASVRAIREIANLIPEVPVIIESVVRPERIKTELDMARKCFQAPVQDIYALEASL